MYRYLKTLKFEKKLLFRYLGTYILYIDSILFKYICLIVISFQKILLIRYRMTTPYYLIKIILLNFSFSMTT